MWAVGEQDSSFRFHGAGPNRSSNIAAGIEKTARAISNWAPCNWCKLNRTSTLPISSDNMTYVQLAAARRSATKPFAMGFHGCVNKPAD